MKRSFPWALAFWVLLVLWGLWASGLLPERSATVDCGDGARLVLRPRARGGVHVRCEER